MKRTGGERFATLWQRCHRGADALAPVAVFAELVRHYGEPHRRYHNLEHIEECLERFDRVATLPRDPEAVELALWFHDVVFVADARDNERRSAQYYLDRAAGATPRFRRHVCSMIVASNHAGAVQHADLGYVLDIDLAGLANPWRQFRSTTNLVRAEYTHLSDAAFAVAIGGFLASLAARPRIYATDYFHEACESGARANIAALIDEWTRAGYLTPSE